MAPHWTELVAWVSLGVCFACALAIAVHELLPGNRQQMWIMAIVHPVTALYLGPVWLWRYLRSGREDDDDRLRPRHVALAVSHCGAGCTLGDVGGEWIVWAFGMPALGASGVYGPELIADFVLAWTLGIAFQYFSIVPMRDDLGRLEGIVQAVKADTLSILAFQLGLFGWMALAHFVIWQPSLPIASAGHWWTMQVGMVIGFATAWPVNRRLVLAGVKERM